MRESHYFLYRNPATMGSEFWEIAQSGCISTNKETTAENAARDGGIIWCVGKKGKGKTAKYYLYQRIVDTRCQYAKHDETEEGAFRVSLCGRPTFAIGFEKEITNEVYFQEIRDSRILTLGLQLMGLKQKKTLEAFHVEYARTLS
ncbi:hypothetical protein [Deinococcus sp.]|uniref:hypothetical protein n=1 Tax=Deinococcus sp. TaxID=47478 RepID=UPI003C7C0F8F